MHRPAGSLEAAHTAQITAPHRAQTCAASSDGCAAHAAISSGAGRGDGGRAGRLEAAHQRVGSGRVERLREHRGEVREQQARLGEEADGARDEHRDGALSGLRRRRGVHE